MTCRPRADLYINLPALRKLDNMLLVRSADSYYNVEMILLGKFIFNITFFFARTGSGSSIVQETSVSFECLKEAVSLPKQKPIPKKEP